jgi:hypothetical protein
MRRAYVVVGERVDEAVPEVWYAVCHSMKRADELAYEAEAADPSHVYVWYEVVEEDD